MKKLPPTLLLALGVELVTTVLYLVWLQTHSLEDSAVRMSLVFEGASLVTYVLAIAASHAVRSSGVVRICASINSLPSSRSPRS